ncbi:hypothetical protein M0812_28786 [Anaeramoeba flamelloides]|uniref:Uncharacterized protein n=1 Tax=Anaeramoeba flamelloides TaxID=1746091 RepID=A0AAV7YEJ5_9EUKA|nr:hypothetical protein M0812_28786 [Anaeramoeba flamelloides]
MNDSDFKHNNPRKRQFSEADIDLRSQHDLGIENKPNKENRKKKKQLKNTLYKQRRLLSRNQLCEEPNTQTTNETHEEILRLENKFVKMKEKHNQLSTKVKTLMEEKQLMKKELTNLRLVIEKNGRKQNRKQITQQNNFQNILKSLLFGGHIAFSNQTGKLFVKHLINSKSFQITTKPKSLIKLNPKFLGKN